MGCTSSSVHPASNQSLQEPKKPLTIETSPKSATPNNQGVVQFSEPNSPRDSSHSKGGISKRPKTVIPGFKELDYQVEAIDGLLKQVLKEKVDPSVTPIDEGPLNAFVNGLINTNNACYMNVVLQCLARIPGIKDYFLHNDYQVHLEFSNRESKDSIAERFGDFLKTYYAFNRKVIEAEELKTYIATRQHRFNLRTQEDAHEFFLFMIDQMGQELNT